ncbi:MAG: PaaI family thioesterase [Actinomycetota bacterium]|nr:PaaI family thioesterase [Actinomycetota bacterium]
MSFRDLLGITIDERGDGRARLSFDATEDHLNDGGIVHGGAIATLVDCAMGSAVASTLVDGAQPVTADTTIKYLEPSRQGRLVATAHIRKKGKRLVVLEAEVVQDDTGEAVAFATGTFTTID